MNRMTRGAVAAALAATVALGASAPAAVAGPKADHAKATHKTVKATKADKAKATKAERALLKQSTRKQAYLTRLLDSNKLERLEQTAEDAVRKNIEDDIAELEALTAPTTTTPTTTTAEATTPTATTPPAGVRELPAGGLPHDHQPAAPRDPSPGGCGRADRGHRPRSGSGRHRARHAGGRAEDLRRRHHPR